MGKSKLLIILILLLVIASGAFLFFTTKNIATKQGSQVKNSENEGLGSGINTKNWPSYRNEEYGIEFKHPSFLELRAIIGNDLGLEFDPVLDEEIEIDDYFDFLKLPILGVFLKKEKTVNDKDYLANEYTKSRNTFTVNDKSAVVVTNCKEVCEQIGAIEYENNSVLEFYGRSGLISGEDLIVDLEVIIKTLKNNKFESII